MFRNKSRVTLSEPVPSTIDEDGTLGVPFNYMGVVKPPNLAGQVQAFGLRRQASRGLPRPNRSGILSDREEGQT